MAAMLAAWNEEDAVSESVQHPDKNEVGERASQETQPSGTVTRYQSLAL